MPRAPVNLQYLLDKTAIEEVITRYFQALDRALPEQVRSCFTSDIKADYDGRTPIQGIENMMATMNTFQKLASGERLASTHFMGNLNIQRIDGDVAETETYAIAFLLLPGKPERVAMRSLRYLDRLRKVDPASGEWRISERRHTLDWSTEVTANFAATLAQRMKNWP
jgi:SnoaL-like domain